MVPTALGAVAAPGDESASALPAERRLAELQVEGSEARPSVVPREQAQALCSTGAKGGGAGNSPTGLEWQFPVTPVPFKAATE